MKLHTGERLLTTEEAAATISVAAATLRGWRHRKIGPPSFTVGARKVVYPEGQLIEWLNSQASKESA